MTKELSREIRKLEVRLKEFLKEEDAFVRELEECLEKFWELNKNLEKLRTATDPRIMDELVNLREKAIEALCETLKKGSDAEHERSHLLESYGDLILALERSFRVAS